MRAIGLQQVGLQQRAGGVDLPGDVAGNVALAEVVIHGWDVARVTGQPYDEAKAFKTTAGSLAKRLKNLQNQAQALKMKLVPA